MAIIAALLKLGIDIFLSHRHHREHMLATVVGLLSFLDCVALKMSASATLSSTGIAQCCVSYFPLPVRIALT